MQSQPAAAGALRGAASAPLAAVPRGDDSYHHTLVHAISDLFHLFQFRCWATNRYTQPGNSTFVLPCPYIFRHTLILYSKQNITTTAQASLHTHSQMPTLVRDTIMIDQSQMISLLEMAAPSLPCCLHTDVWKAPHLACDQKSPIISSTPLSAVVLRREGWRVTRNIEPPIRCAVLSPRGPT